MNKSTSGQQQFNSSSASENKTSLVDRVEALLGFKALVNKPINDREYFKLNHHEDNVINHRLTWLLAGQPLLLLAYANVVAAMLKESKASEGRVVSPVILSVLSLMGSAMALAILVGVIGAAIAMYILSRRRKNSGIEWAGVSTLSTVCGMIPPVVIPVVLMYGWWRLASASFVL